MLLICSPCRHFCIDILLDKLRFLLFTHRMHVDSNINSCIDNDKEMNFTNDNDQCDPTELTGELP
jgi:hypothetical protein